ncbi:conjugal transfer protein [Bacillus atrophaeus]|uniref:conjugal transfer protein n=1 Tax=Bacillus atrophaeus TaxID=1452 RepID=UPI002E1FB728|nr:conjugal transfer protein [Bacillus atrophaeus]MED1032550.1 conjugal transfer protein [Bacillus atrophaeus]MED1121047.1 conjugal transfer protein [Bacillus atrophaeus]
MNKWGKKKSSSSEKQKKDKKSFKNLVGEWKTKKAEKKIYDPAALKKDQKEKAYQVKRERRVALKPSTFQRVMNIGLVLLLVIVLLGSFNAFRHNGVIHSMEEKVDAATSEENKVKDDYADRPGITYFIQNFLNDYFDIQPGEDNQKKRQDRLKKYLANGLDPDGGIDYTSVQGEQTLTGSRIMEVKGINKTTADVYVDADIKSVIKTERIEKVKEKKKDKKGKKKEVEVEKKVTDTDEKSGKLYYVIRVHADDTGYTVIDLPQPYVPKESDKKTVDNYYADLTEDKAATNNVRTFLESFFNSYVNKDRADDMKFFFKKSNDAQSLEGSYEFAGIEDLKVYPGEKKKQYIVRSDVKLKQSVSGIQSLYGYEFILNHEGADKYEIVEMRNLSTKVE